MAAADSAELDIREELEEAILGRAKGNSRYVEFRSLGRFVKPRLLSLLTFAFRR